MDKEKNITFRYTHKFEESFVSKKEGLKHNIDKDKLELLIKKTNRAESQTQFLFNLLDGDFDKLIEVEEKIKNNFLFYCPSTQEEINKILKMDYGNHHFKFGDINHEIFLKNKSADDALIKQIKTI